MKNLYLIALFFLSSSLFAQEGIKFEQNSDWTALKARAKAEHKYIFLDGYTTWCVPCKEMAANIFPQPKVADFFNQNFINVAVQFDVTEGDNAATKAWYEDARKISSEFDIAAFPTYLFFNPNGDLVYKVIGASKDADEFLGKARASLNPATQYPNLKAQYSNGKRDTAFMATLIKAASNARDQENLHTYVNDYLPTQNSYPNHQNLLFAFYGAKKSTDEGFKMMQKYPLQMDSLFGTGFSRRTIQRMIYEEIVFPQVRENGKVENRGGMILYSGKLIKQVNWDALDANVVEKFPQAAPGIIRYAKTAYYRDLNDWTKFAAVANNYATGSDIDFEELMDYAQSVFQFCNQKPAIQQALNWANLAVQSKSDLNVRFKYVQAQLYYKTGEKQKAIAQLQEVINASGAQGEYMKAELAKMKNNEKTWF